MAKSDPRIAAHIPAIHLVDGCDYLAWGPRKGVGSRIAFKLINHAPNNLQRRL